MSSKTNKEPASTNNNQMTPLKIIIFTVLLVGAGIMIGVHMCDISAHKIEESIRRMASSYAEQNQQQIERQDPPPPPLPLPPPPPLPLPPPPPPAPLPPPPPAPPGVYDDVPFRHDFDSNWLATLADPNAPVSIIRGGQPTCLSGLSSSNKNPPTGEEDDSPSNVKGTFRPMTDKTFAEIGRSLGADKVDTHSYQNGYDAYLGYTCLRKQSRKIKMLEIGLGCVVSGHIQGPKGIELWGQLIPNAQYTGVEFNPRCVEEWSSERFAGSIARGPTSYFKVYQADQSDMERWKVIMREEAENMRAKGFGDGLPPMYDMIVDDGGHTMTQQINTFLSLWPHIKPGGIYVIEDLQTGWMPGHYGGTSDAVQTAHLRHTRNLIKNLWDRIHTIVRNTHGQLQVGIDDAHASAIFRIDCVHFMCVIVKRWKK